MVLETILVLSTLAGGGAAVWFFIDKARAIQWRRPRFDKSSPRMAPAGESTAFELPTGGWPIQRPDPVFPQEVVDATKQFEPAFRLPRGTDIKGDWAEYGDPSTLFPFLCRGSFTGRKKQEYAVVLPAASGEGFKIIALIRTVPNKLEAVELAGSQEDVPWNLFVRRVQSGRYRPGPSATKLGSPKDFRIWNDGINVGVFESADSIFFWVRKSHEFRQLWMSD